LKEYPHYLRIAGGSLTELETHFLIGTRLHYFPQDDVDKILELTSEICRVLPGLTPKLNVRRS